ncbi:MAG: TonB family protein [Polyangiaceae bacterium]|jgi:iron complex outermembrane recepter protein
MRHRHGAFPSRLRARASTTLLCLFGAGSSVVALEGDAGAQAPASSTANVTPPVVVQHVDAEYPASALPERKHADVVLSVTVDADGHVSKVEVDKSGGADLDEAATVAVRQWLFTPAMRNGKPVASRIKVPFHFAPPAPPPEIVETPEPANQLPVYPSTPGAVGPATLPASKAPLGPAAPSGPAEGADASQDVQVRGRLEARTHGSSDYQVTVGELKAVPRTNASDALKLAPGFLLTNEGGSGHAEQVFLRGFDAHEGQDLEFSVDGVPINDAGNYHGNGYADTHFIIPELIHSVRVLEGPYAPQQGDFAVAGSADYQLGLDRRGLTAEYSIGSYNTQRLLLLWGPSDAPSGTFGAAEYFTTDGFGTNRQAKRGTAIGQYEIPVGAKGLVRINATAYATEYNSAGVVREDDYESGRVGFYGTEDPNQIGNTGTRFSLSGTYENHYRQMDVSQQLFVIDRTMRLLEDWTGFLNDVQLPTQSPHSQRGDMIDFHFDELTFGGRGFARWHGEAFGMRQEVEAGYFARVDQTTSTQYRDMAQPADTPYMTDADLTSTLGDVGVYLDGNVHLMPWLTARGGVRADMFMFDVLNNCAVNEEQGVDSPSKQYLQVDQPCLSQLEHGVYREPVGRSTTGDGAIMPRGTLILGPFDRFEFAVSAGNGVRSVDPSYVAQGLLTPFVNVESQDLGATYNNQLGTVNLVAKSVFFRTHADQDLLFDPTQGRSTLSTGSTREGWSGSVRALGSFFDVAANATLVKATFDDTHLLVPYVPDLVLRADAVVFDDLPWRIDHKPVRATIAYGVSYVGQRPLPYGQVSDVIFISDASAGVGWSIFNVRLSAQNLFNAKYKLGEYNYASDFHSQAEPTLAPERSFTAGAPQTVMLSLSATLGGPT